VVTRGSWSRIVGKVKPTVYRKLEETTTKKKITKKINITIPRELIGKKLDVFTLNVDPATLKADIKLDQQTVDEKDNLDVEVEAKTGKTQYIVIVEPEKTRCVFTRVS
jgi:restriction endonuclease